MQLFAQTTRRPRPGRGIVPSLLVAVAVGLLSACAGEGTSSGSADLVLTNGKIVTVDDANPEVEAVAIAGDTIVAVGSSQEMDAYVGDGTRVIDLDGRLAIPGFVESHGHFMGLGGAQLQLDLLDATTWNEIVTKVDSAVQASRPGQWIRGRGWHQEKFTETPDRTVEGFPTLDRLDEVAPDNPVILTHASGHAAIANSAALEAAGVGPDTESPPGGEIIRPVYSTTWSGWVGSPSWTSSGTWASTSA